MRIVDRDELMELPAGTIYSDAVESKYVENLEKKGRTDGDGWWRHELLPQRTCGAALPYFQPMTWCPRASYDPDDRIFIYDHDDVRTLIASLETGH